MEKYLELASRYGLQGEDALKFASERMDKDIEREERRLDRDKEREKEREEREKEREEREKEREEREKEREEREKERKHELQKLQYQSEIESTSRQATNLVQTPKLPPFVEDRDEMDSYLLRFERFARAAGWEEEQWAVSLSALLTGKALDIYYRMNTEDSSDYQTLKNSLLKRYGLTAEGYRKKLRESRPEQDETPGQFVVRLQAYLKRWIEMGETDDSRDGLKELIILEQFLNTCTAELRLFLKERDLNSLEEVVQTAQQYLEARGQTLFDLNKKPQWIKNTKPRDFRETGQLSAVRSASALQVASKIGQQGCIFCGRQHDTAVCPEISQLSVEERRKRLLSSGSCFLCLRPKHIASTCESQAKCTTCHRKHHDLLCFDNETKTQKKPTQVLAARSLQVRNRTGAALQTARVVAVGPACQESTRILLDSGSNQSFITKRLATKLGCTSAGVQDTQIVTFGGIEKCHKSMRRVSVTLRKIGSVYGGLTLGVAQVENICGPVNSGLTVNESELAQLQELYLADPPELWKEGQEIDILLGMDYYQDVMTGCMRHMSTSGPIAMESMFGWILGGRVRSTEEESAQTLFVRASSAGEDLERIWNLESIGIESSPFSSACQEKQSIETAAVAHFENTCTRLNDGRYEVRWPKKENFHTLPEDDKLARLRLERCEKALERSGRRQEYEKAIMQYIDEGYAERAPSTPDGPLHVMSHHAVYKNGKIRIVFDASAGHPRSLNDCVLAGPNLIADLAEFFCVSGSIVSQCQPISKRPFFRSVYIQKSVM